MARAVETAEVIAQAQKLPLAKDPRLAEIRLGRWEGMSYDDVNASPDYQKFVADPLSEGIPGGERLTEVRDRATGAIRHLLAEAPAGDHVAVVTHAAVVRILLAHYLGMSLASYHLLKVAPGSVSVIGFKDDRAPPRILAVNVCGSLADVH